MKQRCAFLCAALLAVGVCAPAHGDSEVIVQRARRSLNSGFKERIYVDGKQKLVLANGESGSFTVSDGNHDIYAELYSLTTNTLSFSARADTIRLTITPYSASNFVIESGDGGLKAAAAKPAEKGRNVSADDSVEGSLERAAVQIMAKLPEKSKLAIVYITSKDAEITEFIANELEFIMVGEGLVLVDRSQLDRIRKEQHFQISGDVDDKEAVSIGKMAGANVIITGAVTGSGSLRRLRLRALNTQTAQVLVVASEKF